MADYSKLTKKELIMTLYARDLMLENERKRLEYLVEAEFNRKWANKYVEMRRKEDPLLCLPDSDEVYEKYFELKQKLHDLPKKIVEEIRDVAGDYWDFNICEECGNVPDLNTLTMEDFDEILDAILEKFGEEDESNND